MSTQNRPDAQDLEVMLDQAAEAADLDAYRLVQRAMAGDPASLARCAAIWNRVQDCAARAVESLSPAQRRELERRIRLASN